MHRLLFPLLLSIACSCSCGSRASGGAPKPDSPDARSIGAVTETAPATDFRHQFVAAAQAISPALVSIKSEAAIEGPALPEGSPFDWFFRDLPGLRGSPPGAHKQLRRGIGSGVIVDTSGHVLTNNHVVEGAEHVVVVLPDDSEHEGKVVGADPKTDLAVVKFDADGHPVRAAVLGDSTKLEAGEWVVAAGSPFGLKQTVSAGIVSAVGRGNVGISEYEDFIQTDAAINPGNSGGPLVDLAGRVVGINTAIASQSGGNNGVGFAIPIAMAKIVMDQLITSGKVVRGYIGLYIGNLSAPLAKSFDYHGGGGALVQDISAGGPAEKAGIKAGDIIYELGGRHVDNAASFRNEIAETKPGTEVTLELWRDGKAQSVKVTLGELPGEAGGKSGAAAGGAESRARWGLQLIDPTPELRSQLELGDQRGALVMNVEPDSPADDAGLKQGDLITSVEGEDVADAASAQKLLQQRHGPVRLRVQREGHGMFAILTPRSE